MEIQTSAGNYKVATADVLVVAVFKDENVSSGILQELDSLNGGVLGSIVGTDEMKGKEGEIVFIPISSADLPAKRLMLIGVGEKEEYKPKEVAILSGTAARFVRSKGLKNFSLVTRCEADPKTVAACASQGFFTSLYDINKYQTVDKDSKSLDGFTLVVEGANEADLKSGIERGQAIGESMNFTRDLCNEPPNILTPTEMANRAENMAAEVGLKCEILDEAEMVSLGMGSLMSVSIGSEQPAKLIVLRYEPANGTAKNGELIALVGKGITFDTGGISLKPAEHMDAMKYDMTGGGTVIGTMRAIGLLKPSVPVLGIVAAVENMPDGNATRPSDVVTAMTGKTVEILNTDAEGRLILADAVAYAEKQGATTIIDMATLTGAVIIALGDVNTGILGNDQGLVDEIIACGKEVGENFWQLPVSKEYSKLIKSDIADIKNIGPRMKAGTIMGAVFIQEFIDKAKWAHLDIAGTAWHDDAKPHRSKGPSGVAIRTLLKVIEKSQ